MAQTIIGLDIGAGSIKMTRLRATPFRFEFIDFSEHSLPFQVDLPWEQLVINVLQVLFSDRETTADKVIASIPGRHVTSRIIRLPFSDKKKIEQALPFELEGLLPLALENVLLDYQILAKDNEGVTILALCTEKKLLEAHLNMLQEGSVEATVIIPPAIGLANLGKEIDPESEAACALIDMGEKETSLCVLKNNIVQYTRSWALGASRLTQALQQGLELSSAQAQELKEKEAELFPAPTPGGDSRPEWVADMLKKALKPIVGNIRQSLMSISKQSHIAIEKIYLCGRGSELKGLSQLLSEEMQTDVSPLVLTGPAGNFFSSNEYHHGAMATSLGLACHGVRETAATRLNLRTGEYTFVSERTELKKQLITGGIMAGVLLIMLFIYGGSLYHLKKQEYKQLSALIDQKGLAIYPELKDLPAGAQRNSAIKTRIEQEKREKELFAPLLPDSFSVLDILLAVTNAVPKDVKIDVREMVMDGDKVRIEGETDSYASAEEITKNLRASDLFIKAEMPESKKNLDQTKVKFKMSLQLSQKIL